MGLYLIPLFIFMYFLISYFSTRNSVTQNFHRVDQAYQSMVQMQDKRIATINQFSRLWESDQSAKTNNLDKIKQLSARLNDAALTKAERNGLHSEMDKLIVVAKFNMLGKTNKLSEKQMQLLIASVNEVEEQLSAARRSYYAAVSKYNASLETFMYSTFASGLDYEPVDPYESTLPEILELTDLPGEELLEREDEDDLYFS